MCYTQLPNLEKKLLSLKNRIYVFSMEISSLIENKILLNWWRICKLHDW
jgi:hypothetical protein